MADQELFLEIQAMKQKIAMLERQRSNSLAYGLTRLKKRMNKRLLIPTGIVCFLVATSIAFAASIPNTFYAGDPISASQMNENFSYLIDRLWEVTGANLHYSAGNVGIGTSSPSQKLEVVGTVDADAFTVNGTPVGTSSSSYWNQSGSDLNYTLGDVGIGTASPVQRLHIHKPGVTASDYSYLHITTGDSGSTANDGLDVGYTHNENAILWVRENTPLLLATNDTERMRIDNSGNIGIGTTSPTANFQIGDLTNPNVQLWATGTQAGMSLISNDTITSYINLGDISSGSIGSLVYFNNTDTMQFRTNGSYQMAIDSSGNVGIGTTTPAYQLELSTDSAGKPTSNTWTIVSDERLKEDIKPFVDGLDTIMRINPVSYQLNGKADKPKGAKGIGVVAQDVVDVIPYAVSTFKSKLEPEDKEETELYSFDSSSLTFVLINAVKELKAENDDLKRRIALLEKNKE